MTDIRKFLEEVCGTDIEGLSKAHVDVALNRLKEDTGGNMAISEEPYAQAFSYNAVLGFSIMGDVALAELTFDSGLSPELIEMFSIIEIYRNEISNISNTDDTLKGAGVPVFTLSFTGKEDYKGSPDYVTVQANNPIYMGLASTSPRQEYADRIVFIFNTESINLIEIPKQTLNYDEVTAAAELQANEYYEGLDI